MVGFASIHSDRALVLPRAQLLDLAGRMVLSSGVTLGIEGCVSQFLLDMKTSPVA